ncbi:MAG: PAS domain-containing protein, partial [Pseudomonadota bacterium]
MPLLAGLVIAAALSIGLVWLLGQTGLVAVAYAGGILTIGILMILAARLNVNDAIEEPGLPDWSVTVAAIENRKRAVVITDRANRVTCANGTYEDWFGELAPPVELAFDEQSREGIVAATRTAWRDGQAAVELLFWPQGQRRFRVELERSGRADDYLIWRFAEIVQERGYDGMEDRLSGAFGLLMSNAGVEMALVDPNGTIMAHTTGLADRAVGNIGEGLEGREFVELLRSDERDRIFFAREGQEGAPQTLVQIPLDEVDPSVEKSPEPAPSLMMLIDSGVGIGGGWESRGRNAVPQLNALLSALPLGLALTDRDGRFMFANKAFLRAVEHEKSGLPQYPSDLVVHEDKAAMSDTVRRFAKGPASPSPRTPARPILTGSSLSPRRRTAISLLDAGPLANRRTV